MEIVEFKRLNRWIRKSNKDEINIRDLAIEFGERYNIIKIR